MEVREVPLADGTVITCRLSGDPSAPAMVLLHALGEQTTSWAEVAPRFATQFRVVALDLRGHGASTWPGVYSFPLMRDDVLGVLDAPPPFPRDRPTPARPAGDLGFDWAVVPAVVEEINDPSLRWWKHLRDITAPTLLVGGGPTSHIPQELLVDVSRAVPDCTLITIPAGHDVHESEPDTFAKTVLKWLGTGSPAPGPGPSQ